MTITNQVGCSASGKSTLCNSLVRDYDGVHPVVLSGDDHFVQGSTAAPSPHHHHTATGDITAPSTPSLRHHCTATAHHHRTVTAPSLHHHRPITAPGPPLDLTVLPWPEGEGARCTITAPSLHHHCTVTAPSLYHHCTVTVPSPYHHRNITTPSPCHAGGCPDLFANKKNDTNHPECVNWEGRQ